MPPDPGTTCETRDARPGMGVIALASQSPGDLPTTGTACVHCRRRPSCPESRMNPASRACHDHVVDLANGLDPEPA